MGQVKWKGLEITQEEGRWALGKGAGKLGIASLVYRQAQSQVSGVCLPLSRAVWP